MKLALPLLWASLILFAACSSRKPINTPACIWKDGMKAFSCGQAEPYRKWIMMMDEADGFVCYPPEQNEALLKKLGSCIK